MLDTRAWLILLHHPLTQESLHFLKYKKSDNQLYVFADDTTPRYITTALPLDYDSVAASDKFGNFFVARLPADISAQVCCVFACIARLC